MPRKLSLRNRLILMVLPLIAIFMLFNYRVIIEHERQMLEEETRRRALAIARVLAANSADAIAAFNTHDLQLTVDQISKASDDVLDVEIINGDGKIEASRDLNRGGMEIDDPLVRKALKENEELVSFDRQGTGRLEVVKPITITGPVVGAVRLVLSLASMHQATARSSDYLLALTGVLLVGSLTFMFVVVHWFTGPIQRLANVAHAIATGELERKAEVRSGDEVAILARAINEMSSRLRGMMEKERQARENLQGRVKELLASAEQVATGDLDVPPAPEGPDEMGRLAAGFNDMVRNLRLHMEIQQATLFELEESSQALADANRQLKELDKLKSEFLNTVSHELRTPLTSIKAFSEILLDAPADDLETQQEFLNIINQESDRLTRLINNLLDLSRIEAGRMQWDMEPLVVDEVISVCANAMKALVDKKGLTLIVDSPGDLRMVADRDKLIQILNNLVSNAVKFTGRGGKVRIIARRVEDQVEIVVADTGMGIPPEFHDRIFEKFQQVDTSSTREAKGSGLGLPIVRTIIEAHGGTVGVESEPGKGSRFIVKMPVDRLGLMNAIEAQATAAAAEEAEPAPRPAEVPHAAGSPAVTVVSISPEGDTASAEGEAALERIIPAIETAPVPLLPRGPRRIMVVDDEFNIMRVMRHILEAEGYTVLEAYSGMEALKMAREERPDLVLLDVLLPDVDGFEVLERMRRDPAISDIPVVMLSILEAKEESFRLGAQDYFNKPIDRGKLLDCVQSLLGEGNQEIKVLVVDDDPHILQAVSQMLSSRGYRVVGAKDGLEAVVRARDEVPQLIVLDLYMPEMDGFEVIRRLRNWEETAHIPILVLTASDVALDEAKALTLGAARYMNKPFSETELARVVREAVSQVSGRRQEIATGGSLRAPASPAPPA